MRLGHAACVTDELPFSYLVCPSFAESPAVGLLRRRRVLSSSLRNSGRVSSKDNRELRKWGGTESVPATEVLLC